jgi:hypothetical protein
VWQNISHIAVASTLYVACMIHCTCMRYGADAHDMHRHLYQLRHFLSHYCAYCFHNHHHLYIEFNTLPLSSSSSSSPSSDANELEIVNVGGLDPIVEVAATLTAPMLLHPTQTHAHRNADTRMHTQTYTCTFVYAHMLVTVTYRRFLSDSSAISFV